MFYNRGATRKLLTLIVFIVFGDFFHGQAQNEVHPFELDDLSHCLPYNARPCKEEESRGCETNFLKRPTIVLMAGPWESSILTAWAAEIILSEVLRFPVYIAGDAGGQHDFYEEGSYTLNPARKYPFDALENADLSSNLQCTMDYTQSLTVPDEIKDEPACQVSYFCVSRMSSFHLFILIIISCSCLTPHPCYYYAMSTSAEIRCYFPYV